MLNTTEQSGDQQCVIGCSDHQFTKTGAGHFYSRNGLRKYMDINDVKDLSPNTVLPPEISEQLVKRTLSNIFRKHGAEVLIDFCYHLVAGKLKNHLRICRLDISVEKAYEEFEKKKEQ